MSATSSTRVVIFRARHRADLGADYEPTVLALKARALKDYDCLEFLYAVTPDGEEIAISFWPDEAALQRWKRDEAHRAAQRQSGRWYADWRIQVGSIERDYGAPPG